MACPLPGQPSLLAPSARRRRLQTRMCTLSSALPSPGFPAQPLCSLMPKVKQTLGKLQLSEEEPLSAAPPRWEATAGGSYQPGKRVRKEGGCHSLCCPVTLPASPCPPLLGEDRPQAPLTLHQVGLHPAPSHAGQRGWTARVLHWRVITPRTRNHDTNVSGTRTGGLTLYSELL